MRRELVITTLVAFNLLAGNPALAASATAPPAASASDDRLKPIFEALPEEERRNIQESLLWTGDYAGVVNGAFGTRTRDGLLAFVRKAGVSPDMALDPKSRALLLAAAATARAAVGFAPVKDKQAGVDVSLPLKLLPRRVLTEGGTHYASIDGTFVVDTLSRPAGPGGLQDVFDRMSATAGSRKVTYKLLKADFFVVTGEIGDKKFYSRFALGILDGQSLIRGLTLAYPKADATQLDPVALAAAASFGAFPASDAVNAGTLAAPQPAKPAPPPATFALTAIRIDARTALTHLPGQSCQKPSLDGALLVLRKSDVASGLALFDLPSGPGTAPVLASDPASPATTLIALFNREPEGLDVAPADVQPQPDVTPDAFVVSTGIQGRAEGSPIVDRQGRLAGIVTEPHRLPPSVAGTRLQSDYPVIAAGRLRTFLADAAAGAGAEGLPKTLAGVVALWRPRLIRIVCQVGSR